MLCRVVARALVSIMSGELAWSAGWLEGARVRLLDTVSDEKNIAKQFSK
jgi:hypothetical protein